MNEERVCCLAINPLYYSLLAAHKVNNEGLLCPLEQKTFDSVQGPAGHLTVITASVPESNKL